MKQPVERRLAAILAADVAGYSRLMADRPRARRALCPRGERGRTGDQVQMNAQLIDAENGAHVWANRFDTNRANLPEAQTEITGRLARTLHLELGEAVGRRIEQAKAVDPDARDFVMRGWALFYRPFSMANRREAQRAFEQGLEIDPRSVDARIGIALVLATNVGDGWSSSIEQDKARAEQLLLEAFERDANRSMAHYAMGMLHRVQNRLAESQIEFETAIALDRNNARAFYQLASTLLWIGQPEAGIPYIQKAIRLNPHDPNRANFYASLGMCHLVLGHVDEAIDLLRKARAENPRFWFIHFWLAGTLGLRGDLDEARAALAASLQAQAGDELAGATACRRSLDRQPALLGAPRKNAQCRAAASRFPRRMSAMRTVSQLRGHSATQATPRRLAASRCSA